MQKEGSYFDSSKNYEQLQMLYSTKGPAESFFSETWLWKEGCNCHFKEEAALLRNTKFITVQTVSSSVSAHINHHIKSNTTKITSYEISSVQKNLIMRKCFFHLNIIFMIPTKENEEMKDDHREFKTHNSLVTT